jgi:hypothetical protein
MYTDKRSITDGIKFLNVALNSFYIELGGASLAMENKAPFDRFT